MPGEKRIVNEEQELLETVKKEKDFRTKDSWRVFRILGEFVEGFDTLSRVGPAVAIFGSSRFDKGSQYYKAAVETAWEDGYITEKEQKMLEALKEALEIPGNVHKEVWEDVKKRRKKINK